MGDVAHQRGGDRRGVDVRVVRKHPRGVDAEGRVLIRRVAVCHRDRRVVHRVDRQGNGDRVRVQLAVVRRIGERVRPVVIGVRLVVERTVVVQGQRPVRRAGNEDCGDGRRVDVGVVRQHTRRGHVQGRVLIRRVTIRNRHRSVVDRIDREIDRNGARVQLTVVRLVREGVRAVVVGVRLVAERAVVVQGQRPVRNVIDQHGGDRRGVDVRVIRENAGSGNVQRRVFICRVAIRHRDRRIVYRIDRKVDRHDVRVECAVVRLIGERVRTVVVGVRRVGERAVVVERQRAVSRTGCQDCRDRCRVDV